LTSSYEQTSVLYKTGSAMDSAVPADDAMIAVRLSQIEQRYLNRLTKGFNFHELQERLKKYLEWTLFIIWICNCQKFYDYVETRIKKRIDYGCYIILVYYRQTQLH
jgi:hypothetical protein